MVLYRGTQEAEPEETIQLWLTRHGAGVQYSDVQCSTVQPIYIRISWRWCTGLYEYNLMMGHSKDSCNTIVWISRYLHYLLPVASGATGQLSPGAGWAEAAACGLSLSFQNIFWLCYKYFCFVVFYKTIDSHFGSDLFFTDMVRLKYHV